MRLHPCSRAEPRFHLTGSSPFSSSELTKIQFTPDMKRIFVLSMLISLAMICSCQKQDSAVEQQLAQRKTELDTREEAVIEREKVAEAREKALNEREKALAQNKKVTANAQAVPPDPQSQDALRDAAQMKALMSDPSRLNSLRVEKDRRTQERRAQREAELREQQSQRPSKSKISGAGILPAAENSPTASPAVEATSPTISPAVEDTSPTLSPTPR